MTGVTVAGAARGVAAGGGDDSGRGPRAARPPGHAPGPRAPRAGPGGARSGFRRPQTRDPRAAAAAWERTACKGVAQPPAPPRPALQGRGRITAAVSAGWRDGARIRRPRPPRARLLLRAGRRAPLSSRHGRSFRGAYFYRQKRLAPRAVGAVHRAASSASSRRRRPPTPRTTADTRRKTEGHAPVRAPHSTTDAPGHPAGNYTHRADSRRVSRRPRSPPTAARPLHHRRRGAAVRLATRAACERPPAERACRHRKDRRARPALLCMRCQTRGGCPLDASFGVMMMSRW